MPQPLLIPSKGELIRLTLPQMGLMLCHLAISMTDIWTAGMIDTAVQASVGAVSQIFAFLMLLTSLAGSGCMATVSQSLGAGLERRADRYGGLIIMLSSCGGTAVALAALPFRNSLFAVLGISEAMRPALDVFFTAYCCQLPFYYVLIMINSIFRAHRKVLFPMFTLAAMAAANALGDLGFGLGLFGLPPCGAAGIAWSSFAAALLGLASNVLLALHYGLLGRRSFASWKWCRRAMPYIFRVGIPAAAGQLLMQACGLATLAILGSLPVSATESIAGMTLGMRIHSILMFPLGALNMSMTILSGHLLGSGRRDILLAFGRRTAVSTAAVLVIPSLCLLLFRQEAAAAFSHDPEAAAQASLYLLFACIGGPISGMTGVLHGIFAGAGATAASCRIGAITGWAIGIPLSWAAGISLGFGPAGIYGAGLAAQLIAAAWTFELFRRSEWMDSALKRSPAAPGRLIPTRGKHA